MSENKLQQTFEKLQRQNSDEDFVIYFDKILSSKGKCFNSLGQNLKLDEKNRYFINKKMEYATRALVVAFKIKDYEKLDTQNFVVSFKSGNEIDVNNLIVLSKSDAIKKSECSKRSHKSEEFKNACNMDINALNNSYNKVELEEFPTWIFYENGIIYNTKISRVLTGSHHKDFSSQSLDEGYLSINTPTKSYKYHTLICMAFHPLPGKTKYDDYKELQVNHIDGNPQNNAADNLEWCTQSENQLHKNQKITKGNQQIKILDATTKNLIREFVSVAETARFLYEDEFGKFVETEDKEEKEKYRKKCVALETRVRDRAKGKYSQSGKYIFEYADDEKREAFQEKYSKHVSK